MFLQNIIFCAISVLVVSSLMLGHPILIFIVLCVLLLIVIDLWGLTPILGIDLNSISVTYMILVVGFVMGYIGHVIRVVAVQDPWKSRDERTISMMRQIGVPVLHGVLSTLV